MDYYKILGINKNATVEEIKKAAKKLLLKHHPDQTKKDTNAKVREIIEAKNKLLKMKKERSLVKKQTPTSKTQLSNIVKEVMKHQPKKTLEEKTKILIKSEKERIDYKLKLPKITSKTIMGILTLIYLFPEQASKLPIFGNNFQYILESSGFGLIWLQLIMTFGLLWLMIWLLERVYLRKLNFIMSKKNLKDLYERAKEKFSKKSMFSKPQFEKLIDMPTIPFIKMNEVNEIANTILAEFLDKELIEKVKRKDIEYWYKF